MKEPLRLRWAQLDLILSLLDHTAQILPNIQLGMHKQIKSSAQSQHTH